ncbi:hypothetical protein [Clostridium lundense]|uniref:hypothetical protein n=1 Tax=Clostridium lundense TaxID=319475 RepID=UPI0004898480|nr:hypothetical protein [Clostridium lundense]
MKNTSCENLNETFPKSDIIILYNEKGESYIKISYQCFAGNEWRKSGVELKEIIYKNQYVPKDYKGSIVSIKRSICNKEVTYETMSILCGKINQYKFELYNLQDKTNLLEKAHRDISGMISKNYSSTDLKKGIKYRSLYNKKKFGRISLFLNRDNRLIDLIVDNNKFSWERAIENIMNYEAFLLKFEILNKTLIE